MKSRKQAKSQRGPAKRPRAEYETKKKPSFCVIMLYIRVSRGPTTTKNVIRRTSFPKRQGNKLNFAGEEADELLLAFSFVFMSAIKIPPQNLMK